MRRRKIIKFLVFEESRKNPERDMSRVSLRKLRLRMLKGSS